MLEGHAEPLGSPGPFAVRFSADLERRMLELVVDGLERWKAGGFNRNGDTENEFTAVVLGHMWDAQRERNLPFRPSREQVEDSEEVLAGKSDPSRSPRIDIAVLYYWLAEDAYYTIECKRLAPGELARKYVVDGMLRFTSAKYSRKASFAAMLGYVVGGDPGTLWQDVNEEVRKYCTLRDKDCLVAASPIGTLLTVYMSQHTRSIEPATICITHLFYDVQTRPPSPLRPPSRPSRRKSGTKRPHWG